MCRLCLLVFVPALVAGGAVAQNQLQHYDGTTEYTSRGAFGVNGGTIFQRLPGDQICGAAAITEIVATLQDQNTATTEQYTFEIRRNDPNGPPSGQPDMSPAGLLASVGPITAVFSTAATINLMTVSTVFSPPLQLPPPTCLVPADDLYVGLAFPASPQFPNDGISCHISGPTSAQNAGEQNSATTSGYSGQPGVAGMSWEYNATTGLISLSGGNRAWNIATRFTNDVLQPFAANTTVFTSSPVSVSGGTGTGANPNYGYAGIFPDEFRTTGPDDFGFRVRSSAPPGSTAYLFISFAFLSPPWPLPGFGYFCIDPSIMIPNAFEPIAQSITQSAVLAGTATSEALFGPYPGTPVLVGGIVPAQAATVSGTTIFLSNAATLHF